MTYKIDGGCAALVALFLGKRLYVANAGDCRYCMTSNFNFSFLAVRTLEISFLIIGICV